MEGSRGRPIDQEKRAAIRKAAGHLFFTRGLDAVRLEDIAREAGVSKMTIYNAFGDKEGLFDADVSGVSDEMVALSPPAGAAEVGIARRYSVASNRRVRRSQWHREHDG